jgi:hypothetical protein
VEYNTTSGSLFIFKVNEIAAVRAQSEPAAPVSSQVRSPHPNGRAEHYQF